MKCANGEALALLTGSHGTYLAAQWSRIHTFTVGGTGSIPGSGTKIPHATQCGQNMPPSKKKPIKTQNKESFYTGVFSAVSLSSILAQPCPLLEDKMSQLASTEHPQGVWGHS